MNRQELTHRTSIRPWLRNSLIGSAFTIAAVTLVTYSGVDLEAVDDLSMERQKYIYYQPAETQFAEEVAGSEYVQKRKAWEKRLLQLRREKEITHPDMQTATQVIPLLLKAEDIERRLGITQAERAEDYQQLTIQLHEVDQQLHTIEHNIH